MAHPATIETLDTQMKFAEHMAKEKNARFTPIRRHVYKCLIQAETPIGAYEILDMLDGVGAAKPPTVYRALDWLIDIGLAKKIESISKYMAKTSQAGAEQLALLLCKTCGHAEPFDAGPVLQSIGDLVKSKGFQKDQTVIQSYPLRTLSYENHYAHRLGGVRRVIALCHALLVTSHTWDKPATAGRFVRN